MIAINKFKFLLIIFALTTSPLIFGEYITGNYYFCEDESGRGVSGVFGIQQRNGTILNPSHYDPKQPSREYIYFLNSSYPIPIGYLPIIEESEKEIFLEGRHFAYSSKSKKEEPLFVTINKETLLMNITLMDYKGNSYSINSKCCKSFIEAKILDDGTFQPRECK